GQELVAREGARAAVDGVAGREVFEIAHAGMIASQSMPTLSFCDVDGNDRTLEIGPMPIIIGRNPESTIRSDDGRVSRQHAKMYLQVGAVWIEDLGSANGVWVGGQRVSISPVPIGELVVAGSLLIRVLDEYTPPRITPGAHTQLWEWLLMERHSHKGVIAER